MMKIKCFIIPLMILAVSCSSTGIHKENTIRLLRDKKPVSAFFYSAEYVKNNPDEHDAYSAFIMSFNKALDLFDYFSGKIKEVTVIKTQKKTMDRDYEIIRKIENNFNKIKNNFNNNSKISGNKWFPTVKADLEKADIRLKDVKLKFREFHRNGYKVVLASLNNAARRLYNSGIYLRDIGDYRLAKIPFNLSYRYNREYTESVKLITSAMDLHEQALKLLKTGRKSPQAEEFLRKAMSTDPYNRNIAKDAKPFISDHLAKAIRHEKNGLSGAAVMEYWHVLRFFHRKQSRLYRNRFDRTLYHAKRSPLVSIALVKRDTSTFARKTQILVRNVETRIRRLLKSLRIKPGYIINSVGDISNSAPGFKNSASGGVDLGLGITIRGLRVEEDQNSEERSKNFTLCKKCKTINNPEREKLQKEYEQAVAGLNKAKLGGGLGKAAGGYVIDELTDRIPIFGGIISSVSKKALSSSLDTNAADWEKKIKELEEKLRKEPYTVIADDVRPARWREITMKKTGIAEIDVNIFAPDGAGSLESFSFTVTYENSDKAVMPGEYADKINLTYKKGRLKSNAEVERLVFNRAIEKTVENISKKLKNNMSGYILGNISGADTDTMNRDKVIDFLIKVLVQSKDPENNKAVTDLERIFPNCEIKKMVTGG